MPSGCQGDPKGDSNVMPVGCWWVSVGLPVGFHWAANWIPVRLSDSNGITVGFAWGSIGIPIGFQWDFCLFEFGCPMQFQWSLILGCKFDSMWIPSVTFGI